MQFHIAFSALLVASALAAPTPNFQDSEFALGDDTNEVFAPDAAENLDGGISPPYSISSEIGEAKQISIPGDFKCYSASGTVNPSWKTCGLYYERKFYYCTRTQGTCEEATVFMNPSSDRSVCVGQNECLPFYPDPENPPPRVSEPIQE